MVFKFNRGVGPVTIADLDGDGDHDLAVMDNQKAHLVLLFRDPAATGVVPEGGRFEDPDGFRREEIPIGQRVGAIAAADLDHDGHIDLALHSPGSLEIRWGGSAKRFSERDRFRTPDSLGGSSALVIHPSEQPEIFLLARRGVYQLSNFSRDQAPDRELHPGSASNPRGLFVLDLDGDGVRDLLTVVEDKTHPYRLRLGVRTGTFGPESMIEATAPIAISTVLRDGRTVLVAALREHGRFEELELDVRRRRSTFDLENPDVYPLDAQGLDQPQLVSGDFDGDGDSDLAITHRKDGTILLLLNDKGKLRGQDPSPTVRQLGSIAAADIDDDGKAELVIASADEKVVGVSRLEDASLSFPKMVAEVKAPKLAAPGSFLDAGKTEIAVLGGDKGRTVSLFRVGSEGALGSFEITSNTDPRDLRAYDLDNDGLDELMVFIPYETPQIYQRGSGADKHWHRVESPGTLEASTASGVTQASNGDLLAAAGNHVRRIRLRESQLEVVYQVNGASATSQIAAAYEVKLDGEATTLVLVDKGDKSVSFYDTSVKQPKLIRSIEGPYGSIRGGVVTDLDRNGREELVLLEGKFLTVLESGGRRTHLKRVFTHQCPRERGQYIDIASGDLNGDGNQDLVLSEGVNHFLEIFRPDRDERWTLGLAFPVYESNTFRGQGGASTEPRTVKVADVTGDGLDDVIIVVHDRLIVYPQGQ